MFEIVGNDLRLISGASLDFETNPTLDVTVNVDDAAIPGTPEDSASHSINVIDANEPPTISLTPGVANLAEDADTSSPIVVATISVTDDALGTETLTLSGADAGMFEIVGNDLRLISGASLDFETNPTLDVTVNVDDAAIPGTPEDSASHSINVIDVNEAPTIVSGTFTASENSPNGTSVGFIGASDSDVGDTVTFAITGGPLAGAFAIDSATGEISVVDGTLLDFESTPTLSLDVEVTDVGGLADSTTVTINLINVNEPPTLVAPNAQSVPKNTPLIFSTVGGNGIFVSDPDTAGGLMEATLTVTGGTLSPGQTTGLAFSVGDGVNDSVMTFTGTLTDVNAALENLTFNPSTDFVGPVTLQVSISDLGNSGTGGPQSAATIVEIDVSNTSPSGTDDGMFETTQTGTSTDAPGVLANDIDADGDPISAVLVTDVAHGTLSLAADGSFVYIPDAGFSGIDQFQYAVSDGQSLSTPITVTLNVAPVAPPPVGGGTGEPDSVDNADDADSDSTTEESPSENSTDSTDELVSPGVGAPAQDRSSTSTAHGPQQIVAAPPESSDDYLFASVLNTHSEQELFAIAARSLRVVAAPITSISFTAVSEIALSPGFGQTGQYGEMIKWDDQITNHELAIGTTAIVSSTLTVGYVIWLLRGGNLLVSLLSSVPAWCSFDPLPIVETFEAARDDQRKDGESLTSMLNQHPAKT